MKKYFMILAALVIPVLASGKEEDVMKSVEVQYCQSLPDSVLNLYPSKDGLIGYCTLRDGKTVEIHELYKKDHPAGTSTPNATR